MRQRVAMRGRASGFETRPYKQGYSIGRRPTIGMMASVAAF
jgi:hypothetical protein